MEQGTKKNNTVTILAVVLVLSLIGNITLFVTKNQQQEEMQARIDTVYIEKTKVEKELALTGAELDKYMGISDSLDKVVAEGKNQIATLEDDIKKLKGQVKKDASKKKELQAKIDELNALVESYLEKIDQLITENQLLKTQNADLTTEVQEMTEQNKNLQGKVNVAALIKTEYVKLSALKKKVLGDDFVETSLAKKVDKFKVSFTLLPNGLAESGDKNVHIRIIDPNGKVLGGGTFNAGDTGTPTDFTATVIIQYDKGGKASGAVEYAGSDFKSGNYKTEIYIDGILSGGGGVVLK
ncbi:MAG: hypothetical protein IT233_12160 [Bacteroidia bacterium]|nr:hypothetical protein [Bacteroidia bacterium]